MARKFGGEENIFKLHSEANLCHATKYNVTYQKTGINWADIFYEDTEHVLAEFYIASSSAAGALKFKKNRSNK